MSAGLRHPWKLAWVAGGLLALAAGLVSWAFQTVPAGDLPPGAPADVLLVLGSPAEVDGSVTEAQRWRVDEAVREFRAGRAPYLLFTGGAAANRFVEAQVMARYAARLGVPAGRLLEEGRAKTTVENVADSAEIITARGWRRVEVISSPEHLHRAAYLMKRTPFQWRVHPAPTPGRSRLQIAGAYAEEAFGTTAFRLFGPRAEPAMHALALAQHAIFVAARWILAGGESSIRRRPSEGAAVVPVSRALSSRS